MFDKVIDVYQSDSIENTILKERNITLKDKEIADSNQLSKEDKKNKSDYVIYNTSTLSNLKEETIKVIKELGLWDFSKQQ